LEVVTEQGNISNSENFWILIAFLRRVLVWNKLKYPWIGVPKEWEGIIVKLNKYKPEIH